LPNRPGYIVEKASAPLSSSQNDTDSEQTKSPYMAHLNSPTNIHHLIHSTVGLGQIGYIPTNFQPQPQPPTTNFPLLSATAKFQKPSSSPQLSSILSQPGLISSDSFPNPPVAALEPYKSLVETLTQDDIVDKKNFVVKHRLQSHMLQIIEYCKKEGIIPILPLTLSQSASTTDYSLSEFLESQGIESNDYDNDIKGDEFSMKLENLKGAYSDELEKLNKVCQDFVTRMVTLLREQGQVRQVSDQEIHAKTILVQNKFDFVRNQLRINVCNAILVLQKQYDHRPKKKKRTLSKKATDSLTRWFFDHINDPYPSDEEKNMLAAQCVLSLNQVNNWFGNKRIRYKRKCIEGARVMIPKTLSPTLTITDLNSSTSSVNDDSPLENSPYTPQL